MRDKIERFLKDVFWEDWMDDNDWNMFLVELEKESGVSIDSLVADCEIGVKNGYSVEDQLEVARRVINKMIIE